MASAFCEELENAGYYAGIYANDDYVKNMYGEDIFKKYDLWYACWGTSRPSRSVNLWQYSSHGKVNGVSGNVDMDVAFVDFPAIIKERGLNVHKIEHTFVCPHGCPYCPHSNGV
jgi:GH25 family lysozyme M1 (1,4-beta-N-acetylmuramidase)